MSDYSNNIIVPINVQAINTTTNQQKSVKREVDFTKLPYKLGGKTKNNGANISEKILYRAFSSENILEVGIHLHWSIPDALAHGKIQEDGKLIFPLLPNRWIITRISKNDTAISKSWIIESDYLSNNNETISNAVSVAVNNEEQPYRTLGKVFTAEHWKENRDIKEDYLTALGYGSLSFASSYTNSNSVFGFYDDLKDLNNSKDDLSYIVTGWFSNAKSDFLKQINKEYNNDFKNEDILWEIDEPINSDRAGSIYSGTVLNINTGLESTAIKINPEIYCADTPYEALSSLMVHDIKDSDTKLKYETIFNALQLDLLNNSTMNEDKIFSSLHEKKFLKEDSIIWNITNKSTSVDQDDIVSEKLPLEILNRLFELNIKQSCLIAHNNLLSTLQIRIFSDWYKYMLAKYEVDAFDELPSDDTIREYIEKEIKYTKEELDNNKALTKFNAVKKILEKQLEEYNNTIKGHFVLEEVKGARFYYPNDPALIIASKEDNWAFAGDRNGKQNLLKCRLTKHIVFEPQSNIIINNSNIPFLKEINLLINEANLLSNNKKITFGDYKSPAEIAINYWDNNFWLAHNIEWEIDYERLKTDSGEYHKEQIYNNFILNEQDSELQPKFSPSPENLEKDSISGTILLTDSTKFNLIERLKCIEDYLEDIELKQKIPGIKETLSKEKIITSIFSGFTEGCITQALTPQLNISDPFAEDDSEKSFVKSVADIVGKYNKKAPQPNNKFNPIQNGIFYLSRLRIVDIFGRYKEFRVNDQTLLANYPSNRLASLPEDKIKKSWLPVRLLQPARINCQLLTANDITKTSSFNTNDSPICGWIITNNLDKSLSFYEQNGEMIGSLIQQENHQPLWENAIGRFNFDMKLPEIIKSVNYTVGQMIMSLSQFSDEKFADFRKQIEERVELTKPEKTHYSNAFLCGIPLAIVNTSISLEIKGLPNIDYSWEALEKDLNEENILKRSTRNFEQVSFPIRIGNNSLEDGVIGYFCFDNEKPDFKNFYSGAFRENIKTKISYGDNKFEQKLTMIVDPRNDITVYSGILPEKRVTIPDYLYRTAMENIYVTFFMGPLITNSADKEMNIPVPEIPEMHWSWLEYLPKGKETTEKPIPKKYNEPDLSAQNSIYEGWLKLQSSNKP